MQRPINDDLDRLAKYLGDELRSARKAREWNRKELRDQLILGGGDLCVQTLASYELGTRNIQVRRLVQIALTVNAAPQELFHRAFDRTFGDSGRANVEVQLSALAHTHHPHLSRLRQWADARHRQTGYDPAARIRLDTLAVQTMAAFSEVDPTELIAALRSLQSVPGRATPADR